MPQSKETRLMMKTEKEIRDAMEACSKVKDFAMSKGPCPFCPISMTGDCFHCTHIPAMEWVLREDTISKESLDILAADDYEEYGEGGG